jgi:hypothetical protein
LAVFHSHPSLFPGRHFLLSLSSSTSRSSPPTAAGAPRPPMAAKLPQRRRPPLLPTAAAGRQPLLPQRAGSSAPFLSMARAPFFFQSRRSSSHGRPPNAPQQQRDSSSPFSSAVLLDHVRWLAPASSADQPPLPCSCRGELLSSKRSAAVTSPGPSSNSRSSSPMPASMDAQLPLPWRPVHMHGRAPSVPVFPMAELAHGLGRLLLLSRTHPPTSSTSPSSMPTPHVSLRPTSPLETSRPP